MHSVKGKPQNVTLCCALNHPHSEEECGPREGKSRVIDRNWGDAELAEDIRGLTASQTDSTQAANFRTTLFASASEVNRCWL